MQISIGIFIWNKLVNGGTPPISTYAMLFENDIEMEFENGVVMEYEH